MTAILRKEIIGNQRLILGDCLAVMPTLGRFDAMLVDPPYGIGDIMVGSGTFARLCKRMGGENGWDKEPPPKWVFENDFPTIAWGGNYLGLPPSRGWLAWVKNNATTTFASIELAWSNMDFNAKHWIGPVGVPMGEKAGHHTPPRATIPQRGSPAGRGFLPPQPRAFHQGDGRKK